MLCIRARAYTHLFVALSRENNKPEPNGIPSVRHMNHKNNDNRKILLVKNRMIQNRTRAPVGLLSGKQDQVAANASVHLCGRRQWVRWRMRDLIIKYNFVETNMVLMKWQVTFKRIHFVPTTSMECARSCFANLDAAGQFSDFCEIANEDDRILLDLAMR